MSGPTRSKGARLLKAYLEKKGLKQADVVRALKVSRAIVSEWLGGTRHPSDAKCEQLAAWTAEAVPASAWQTPKQRAEQVENDRLLAELRAAHTATGTSG